MWAGQEEEVERGIAIAIVREFNRFLSPFCVLEIICFEVWSLRLLLFLLWFKWEKSLGTLLSVKDLKLEKTAGEYFRMIETCDYF